MRVIIRFLFIVPLALLVSVSTSSAQKLTVGVEAGANLATQQISGGGPSPTATAGLVAGGFVTLPFGSRLALQAEGLYSTKGATLTVLGIRSTLRIDYLEVPLLARYRLQGDARRHFYVVGGAAPALRLRARVRTAFKGSSESQDVDKQVERLDLGIAAGGGMQMGALDVEARYTIGIRDVDADKTDASRTKNRALAVTAGFRF